MRYIYIAFHRTLRYSWDLCKSYILIYEVVWEYVLRIYSSQCGVLVIVSHECCLSRYKFASILTHNSIRTRHSSSICTSICILSTSIYIYQNVSRVKHYLHYNYEQENGITSIGGWISDRYRWTMSNIR